MDVVETSELADDPEHATADVRGLDFESLAVVASVDRKRLAGPAPTPFGGFPTVSVVVPALNEAPNLPYVLPLIPDWITEVILVDGGSTDGTVEVAKALLPEIRIVNQSGRGKGNALRSGFSSATGDIIVMLDADGSTLPTEIPAFVGVLLAGADFAKGSRFSQGGGSEDISLFRRLGNQYFVVMARLLFGGRYTDLCYGYNAFWRRHLPILDLDADGFEVETMMNLRALQRGLKVVEVSSFEACRKFGKSRLRAVPDGLRVLRIVVRERLSPQSRRWGERRRRRSRVFQHNPPVAMPALADAAAEPVAQPSTGIAV
jgi:glycosyltransferase involved in cell wall biosynthesis